MCDRNEVTRSRVQRLPWPVLRLLRLRRPAIRSSPAINANLANWPRCSISGSAVALSSPPALGRHRIARCERRLTSVRRSRSRKSYRRCRPRPRGFRVRTMRCFFNRARPLSRRRPDRLQIGAEVGESAAASMAGVGNAALACALILAPRLRRDASERLRFQRALEFRQRPADWPDLRHRTAGRRGHRAYHALLQDRGLGPQRAWSRR